MDFPVYSGNGAPASTMTTGAQNGFGVVEDDENLPIFAIERVQLQFQITSLVAMAVSNNILYMAIGSGKILRIDLNNPQDIDDVELPKLKSPGTGTIKNIFLDPTGSHLLVTTSTSENFYLHARSPRAKQLSRLKGNQITSVAWNPTEPSSSTKEILIGTSDGKIIETYIEPSDEYFKREERFSRLAWKAADGYAIDGLFVEFIPGKPDMRRLLVSTGGRLWHWVAKIIRHAPGDYSPTFTKFFDDESAAIHKDFSPAARSILSISPDDNSELASEERTFAWLNESGIFYGKLYLTPANAEVGNMIFKDSKLLPESKLPSNSSSINSIALTKYHILILRANEILAVNLLDGSIVFEEQLSYNENIICITSDVKSSTFWIYSSESIYEITVLDEERDIWKIYLQQKSFDNALRFAKTEKQRDAVAIANGEFLIKNESYFEAANVLGKSSKAFESVAITFMELKRMDALRRYLVIKINGYKPTATMQRTMLASWIVELFMEKLNSLEDSFATKEFERNNAPLEKIIDEKDERQDLFEKPRKIKKEKNSVEDELNEVKNEFHEFVSRHKSDLDQKTTYDIIASHGREEELLFYSNEINDYAYALRYWVNLEKWPEALQVLRKHSDPDIYYKYSTVFLVNVPKETVDTWMRVPDLIPRKLIPAILSYGLTVKPGKDQNHAIRYLNYVINKLKSKDAAVHNTLISIYASDPSSDEQPLLEYLQQHDLQRCYDTDFALRLCIKHERVQSCIFIYSSMGLYEEAVNLALKHDNTELASVVADRPGEDTVLRKKLWLRVAKKVISQEHGIKSAIEFLKRCELLKIEDLLPFFPNFVVIDDFKEEICAALEEYSRSIDNLRKDMDESAKTAENIKADIESLASRFSIVEPGERCYICCYPLLARQFYVFPCQHSFHGDCLISKVTETGNSRVKRKITELQMDTEKGIISDELDAMIASECILCGPKMIESIDEPFIDEKDSKSSAEWAL
ncbi:Pep3/Vps18/deep orange family-domain-containing protein [Dipodascopsis uninucleata]